MELPSVSHCSTHLSAPTAAANTSVRTLGSTWGQPVWWRC